MRPPAATWLLEQEMLALLNRLDAVRPFALQETYVAAAAPSPAAVSAIEEHLLQDRSVVRRRILEFLAWLRGPGRSFTAAEQQHRFWGVRLDFQNSLSQFDLFSEVVTQRSESDNGVLLAGLDVAAAEALLLPGELIESPPIVCVLHRGLGGAIRRARTRLPGGGDNPVAIIRIPRERMVGYGIASSLVHEVGHQGAALLDLVATLRRDLHANRSRLGSTASLWKLWISEIVADVWAIAKIGIGSTLGLISLVSLPRGFVFRPPDEDPHPIPWLRVLLSCQIGERLYPDPQWSRLATTWRMMYPLTGVRPEMTILLAQLRRALPQVVSVILEHRSDRLNGRRLGDVLHNPHIQRPALLRRFNAWQSHLQEMNTTAPTEAFAVLGQARAGALLHPEREGTLLRRLISSWALSSALETARATCRHQTDMFVGQPRIWAASTRRAQSLTVTT